VIHPLEHSRGIEGNTGTIDDFSVGIIADTEYLRILRIIDVKIEVITCEYPIEISGGKLR
jgi:hypothetical protein